MQLPIISNMALFVYRHVRCHTSNKQLQQKRCITIVCCVAKIYSAILNKRLQKYLETNNILAEEQNGFRVGRSCIDHIFVMCTVLRNRKMLGKETFLCFIDY